MPTPKTHHRAVALVIAVTAAIGLAQLEPARPVEIPRVFQERPDAGPLRVDPRTATAREIEALPGIGPAIARRVVEARARGLRFERPSDLARVRGIGPRTVERIAPFLVFTGRTGAPPPR
jgi:DNA uptake protein ComE-like DNA-binding protein